MDSRIQSIIIGSILGDGYLTNQTMKRQSRLWLKYDDQCLPYLRWLHREIAPLGVGPIKGKKGYHQHQFLTNSSQELGALKKLFYPRGRKIIPPMIGQLLIHPLTLAIWYMDDGTLDYRDKYHYNALFATHCFSRKDCERLTNTLSQNFNIKASVCRCLMRGKLRYRIYIWSQSMEHFLRLVRPYVLPCLAYKIRKARQQQR